MKRKYPTILWPILAVVWVAFCFSTLLTAQNSTTNSDNNQVVSDQLRQMQQQLNEQQQQINRLQGELKEARGQVKLVNNGTQPELVPIGYSEPPSGEPAAAVAVAPDAPPPGPSVIPAIAPVRVLPLEAPRPGSLIGVKAGPLTFQPYGFVKATAVRNSSNPDGDDFPWTFIFFNTAGPLNNTGPTADPAFHLKARATRFGMNVEWPDVSPKLTMLGRIEADFEGNFNEADNSDVTSIRSPNVRLRIASLRLDYRMNDNTNFYFLGGQDWILFGSGAVEQLVETTINDGWGGDVFNRSPQLRGGWTQTLSHNRNIKLAAEFGVMMPTDGTIGKLGLDQTALGGGLAVQFGQGEREGGDSARPELESRVTLQFQLDQAKGVAPAQVFLSGFYGWRQYTPYDNFAAGTFLTGPEIAALTASPLRSKMYGGQVAIQLPTRWFTATASVYRGADLREVAGGQINSFTTLSCPSQFTGSHGVTLGTLDGGPTMVVSGIPELCTGGSLGANFASAPERPIRAFGGFTQVGFPLSRLFNADPKGRNAGWQLLFSVGKDQVVRRDLTNPDFTGVVSPLPMLMSTTAHLTLFYKLNQWASFGFEQSIYATRLAGNIANTLYPCDGGGGLGCYVIAGKVSNEQQDHRTEFGPIFTF